MSYCMFVMLYMMPVGQTLHGLEFLLLNERGFSFQVQIEAEGAVEANYTGSFEMEHGKLLKIDCKGAFAGKPANPTLQADGTTMSFAEKQEPRPADLDKAVVMGFVRMGLLHNLAVLTFGQGPDGTGGTAAKKWQLASNGDPQAREIEGKKATGLPFVLTSEGQKAAEGVLWLDARGLPLMRTQETFFPNGVMRVTERYAKFVTGVDH